MKRMRTLTRSLRETFGLDELRPGQAEVIAAVLGGEDALAVMPTGAGKSLCYQLPALHLEGTTIVVSPLIALMKDQSDKLRELGLEAVEVNSTITGRAEAVNLRRIGEARSDFVFTTPERMAEPGFLQTLRDTAIDFVVIDEAHCISQWGHDFRPSYLALRQAVRELDDPPILALTATATEEVVEDIRRQLGRPEMRVFRTGIFRPNLLLEVEHVSGPAEKEGELVRLLGELEGGGIVYCATVRNVGEVSRLLQREGFDAEGYHGRLPAGRRHEVQDRFMAGELKAMVATNAFGLGIDKSDIRFVVHYDMPGSLEAYYQEAGRAGRDGDPACCALLYDRRDRRTQLFFLGGRYPDAEDVRAVYEGLGRGDPDSAGLTAAEVQRAVPAVARNKVRVVLALLKDAGLVRGRRGVRFARTAREATPASLERLATAYRERGERDREKLERMEEYARTAYCRWVPLHRWFEQEMPVDRCGSCDNCRKGVAELAGKPVNEVA
ncbi:MAG TPA: ATP-dependent DNA helicase RecQ [Gemmatimonadales bacterium]|nr:ATP-dependent DNA helicase RecQ [Gemmatimonadales bacterium]